MTDKATQSRIHRLMENPNPWVYRPTLVAMLVWALPMTWMCAVGDCLLIVWEFFKETLWDARDMAENAWGTAQEYWHMTTVAVRVGWAAPAKRDALVKELAAKERAE